MIQVMIAEAQARLPELLGTAARCTTRMLFEWIAKQVEYRFAGSGEALNWPG